MSKFQTRLLSLAAFATIFAGASFAQGITSCSAALGVTPGPTNERAEGTTELAGDLNFACVNATASATATVTIFSSAPVTSATLSLAAAAAANAALPGPAPAGATEATLWVCENAAANVATACGAAAASSTGPYFGVVSGNQITFSGIAICGFNFTAKTQDVRVNASAVTLGATLTTQTEQALVSANNTSAATLATTTGFIFKSLVAPSLLANPNGANTPTLTVYTTCGGNALPPASAPALAKLSFGVTVGETFGGAFKTGNGAAPIGEGGSYVPAGTAGTPGYAISGTKVKLVFGNVQSAETLYVPTTVTNTAGSNLTLTLVSSETSVDPVVPVAASTAVGAPAAAGAAPFNNGTSLIESYGASAALTTANGTATAVYEVTTSDNAFIQSAVIPVFVTFASNAFSTTQTAISVLESYAPTATAAAATTVPNFAPPSNTALPATVINVCSTNLLFPFVTSQLGFDTGIVLANTSADPFGTAASPGACLLNFYGAGAPTPAVGIAAPGGTQAAGNSAVFLLSGVAPGFSGYMIAQCTYQFGKGFAYLAYNLTQNNGVSMGYIAEVLTGGRPTVAAPAEVVTF